MSATLTSPYDYAASLDGLRHDIRQFATIKEDQPKELPTAEQLAQAAADGVPATVLDYCATCNGPRLQWQVGDGQRISGSLNLMDYHSLFEVDWAEELLCDSPYDDARLHLFRPVDHFHDTNSVGLIFDERHDPELYYYDFDHSRLYPLRVDLPAYFTLLRYARGFMHWQSLLLLLNQPGGEARPFDPETNGGVHINTIRGTLAALPQVVPGFSVDGFVALFDQLKLPHSLSDAPPPPLAGAALQRAFWRFRGRYDIADFEYYAYEEEHLVELAGSAEKATAFELLGTTEEGGSVLALWQRPGQPAAERPVVWLDADGNPPAVLAASLADFLTLLPYGTAALYELARDPTADAPDPEALLADNAAAHEGADIYRRWLAEVAGLAIAPQPPQLVAQAAPLLPELQQWLAKAE